jgi:hypothetical protein
MNVADCYRSQVNQGGRAKCDSDAPVAIWLKE